MRMAILLVFYGLGLQSKVRDTLVTGLGHERVLLTFKHAAS